MANKYDILILGAGLGGLECALMLSKKGYNVCVLEKNKHIGGTLQNFKLGDCSFSSGMHYLGSLDEGQTLNRLFKNFGILDDLNVKRMDEGVFDRFSINGKTIDYPIGWDRFQDRMLSYFPAEQKAIGNYISLIHEVAESQAIYNLEAPGEYDIRTNPYLQTGIYPAIQSITKNKGLQNALCALNFVYAGDRDTSSLYTHALINNYYIQSAYRLIGGSNQIAELLATNILANQGEIHIEQQVNQLLFEGDRLKGVNTLSGEQFYADKIISNIHPSLTMEMIPEGKIRKSYKNRLKNLVNSISVFGLHLKVKAGSFPYIPYNYYHFLDKDVWAVSNYSKSKWPGFYYLYTPTNAINDTHTNCLSLYAYMNFDEVKKWTGLPLNQRGKDYESWKSEMAERLIETTSLQFPELKENVTDWIAATPLTYSNYIGTPEGGMYGTVRDFNNPMASYVSPRTKIPNLYFTGQNIHLHGMLGVSISALLTCGEIVGLHNIIRDIHDG